jgi:hypothetical protein
VLAMRTLQLAVVFLFLNLASPLAHSAETLATVNGTPITDADVELEIISRNIDREKVTPETRRRILEQLIDLELIVQFLRSKKVRVDNAQIGAQVKRLEDIITENGEDPNEVLKDLGFTTAKLRKKLVDAAMWDNYFNSKVDDNALKRYFENHKQQFDGTEVRGSQIYLKLPENPNEEDIKTAKAKLAEYKKQIEAGEITFAEAARKWSQAPSAKKGGDLGFSMYRGKNPEVLTRVLFDLEKGELSEPFQSPFGMHLMTVTDRVPGTFQLEDVRGIVRNRLRHEMWTTFAEAQREKARIQYAK